MSDSVELRSVFGKHAESYIMIRRGFMILFKLLFI